MKNIDRQIKKRANRRQAKRIRQNDGEEGTPRKRGRKNLNDSSSVGSTVSSQTQSFPVSSSGEREELLSQSSSGIGNMDRPGEISSPLPQSVPSASPPVQLVPSPTRPVADTPAHLPANPSPAREVASATVPSRAQQELSDFDSVPLLHISSNESDGNSSNSSVILAYPDASSEMNVGTIFPDIRNRVTPQRPLANKAKGTVPSPTVPKKKRKKKSDNEASTPDKKRRTTRSLNKT